MIIIDIDCSWFIHCNWWLTYSKYIAYLDFKFVLMKNRWYNPRHNLTLIPFILKIDEANFISIKLKSHLKYFTPWRIWITTVTAHQFHIYMEYVGLIWNDDDAMAASKHWQFSRARFACKFVIWFSDLQVIKNQHKMYHHWFTFSYG